MTNKGCSKNIATSLTEDNAGREAFSVFEDILACEIQAENDALKKSNNDLMPIKKIVQDVTITAFGKEVHTCSILDGVPGDELTWKGLESIASDDRIGSFGGSQIAKDRNLGKTLTFPVETSFTIDAFKQDIKVTGSHSVQILSPSILTIEYANQRRRMDSCCGNCLHLALEKDDTVSFYFFQMEAIFKGKVLNIGPTDMEQGIKALAATIGTAVFFISEVIASKIEGGDLDYSLLDGLFSDSPDMLFVLESISLPLTQGVQKACDLLQGLESRSTTRVTLDRAPTSNTEKDSLRRSVAISTVRGVVVDSLSTHNKLRREQMTLLSMKTLLQTVTLKQGDDTLVEMNLCDASRLSSHGQDFFEFEDIQGISVELNWLDRFSITVGVNGCHQTESKPKNEVVSVGMNVLLQVGMNGRFHFRYGAVHVLGFATTTTREDLEFLAQEDIERKFQKCTESGENPGFPTSFRFKVTTIVIPISETVLGDEK